MYILGPLATQTQSRDQVVLASARIEIFGFLSDATTLDVSGGCLVPASG